MNKQDLRRGLGALLLWITILVSLLVSVLLVMVADLTLTGFTFATELWYAKIDRVSGALAAAALCGYALFTTGNIIVPAVLMLGLSLFALTFRTGSYLHGDSDHF
jgi:K+ transporter